MTIATFLFLSESHHPTLQRRLARHAGRPVPVETTGTKTVLARSLTRPMRMLARSPIITGLSLYLALVYGYLYLLFTTFTTVFSEQYGFGTGVLGLSFLGFGMGNLVALGVLSWMSDSLQVELTTRHGESKPE